MQAINEFLKNTMLIERMFGVITYFFVVLIIYYFLRQSDNQKKIKLTLNCGLIILTIMGFLYIPAETADLYKIWKICDNFANISFKKFVSNYCLNDPTPISNLLFYFVGLLGIKKVLPAIASFVFHYCIFSVLKLINKSLNISKVDLALCFLFVMSLGRFMVAITGIRSVPCLAVLAYCFNVEIIKKRIYPLLVIIEFITCLVHPVCLVVLLIRIISRFILSYRTLLIKILNYVLAILIIFVIIRYGRVYLDNAFEKAENYFDNVIYDNLWERIIAVLLFIFILYVTLRAIFINKKLKYREIRNLIILNCVYLLIEIIFIYEYNIFHRLGSFSAVLCLPLVAFNLKNDSSKLNFRRFVFIYSILILLLGCTRGDLSGYKYFVLW